MTKEHVMSMGNGAPQLSLETLRAEIVTGEIAWADAVADGRLRASGTRADISRLFPLQAARAR